MVRPDGLGSGRRHPAARRASREGAGGPRRGRRHDRCDGPGRPRLPRDTTDLDLAVSTEPANLDEIARALRQSGLQVDVHEPDAQDPLGGVIDVREPGADMVQIVNFDNPPAGGFPRLIEDALREAVELAPGSPIRVVAPQHLIVFKLYAGGAKSKLDILELLDRRRDVDRTALRELCDSYRMGAELDPCYASKGTRAGDSGFVTLASTRHTRGRWSGVRPRLHERAVPR